jgi:protein involved in polysaccharide export with SLBB domain
MREMLPEIEPRSSRCGGSSLIPAAEETVRNPRPKKILSSGSGTLAGFRSDDSCVLPQTGQLGRMEVLLCRTLAVFCVTSFSLMHLGAQTNVPVATRPVPSLLPAPSAIPQPVELDNQHTIRPGDKLSFRIDEDREEAKALVVTDSGEVELPQPFGRFSAAGKTCKALGEEIKLALEKDYYKRATVRLGLDAINKVRGKAAIHGQVAKPGLVDIPVDSKLKLSQAILIAGPPLQWAKLSAVRVVRAGKTMVVDLDAVMNKGRTEKDILLEPDDWVHVPERGVLVN